MKNTLLPGLLKITLTAGLLAFLVSCQPGGAGLPQTAAATPPPAAGLPTAQPGGQTQPGGDLNLADPLVGLPTLKSYRLVYSSTTQGTQKGQSFESSLAVERRVNGADQSELAQQTSTGAQPVYLSQVTLNGARYTQQKAGGPCQAGTSALALNPLQTVKLPPVFGAQLVGSETVNGIPAAHYRFNEKSVPWQAGKTGQAQGEFWLAVPGGYLVKYGLTLQLPSGDFQGTRAWAYELSEVGGGAGVALPPGCLALLTDLPLMDQAAEVIQRPGFQKYTVSAALGQVTNFYTQKLTAAGWTQLAGLEPADGRQTLEFIKDRAEGGSRFAVIQVSEKNGQSLVIIQSAGTQNAIVIDPTPIPGAAMPPNPGETPPAEITLPADLPQYPGASLTVNTPQMLMLKTSDTPQKVLAFYKQGLEKAGFSLDDSADQNGISTQTWVRDPLQVVIVVSQQGGATRIVITAEEY